MRARLTFSVLVASLILFSLITTGYSVKWMRVEPKVVKITPGAESIVRIYVGEEVRNQRVKLTILEKPEWMNYSFSIQEAKTPFLSNLTIKISNNAPTGDYIIRIGLWMGKTLLEEENITLTVMPEFTPPKLYFTNYTCPLTIVVGEKIPLDLSFTYLIVSETRVRVKILLDDQVETMVEFLLHGNGSIPVYRQITAPTEPRDIMITSMIEYFDPSNGTWIISDLRACRVTVTTIPTVLKIVANGLPSNVEVNAQILVLSQGSIIERKVSSNKEYVVDLSIYQPSTILVVVEDEITLSNNTKYVAENNLREIYVEPGWTIKIQFSYSTFYLVSMKVEPNDDILKILEKDEWVKRGGSFPISAPKILQSSSKRYVLSWISVDGKMVNDTGILEVYSPQTITYRYVEYNKLGVITRVKLPSTLSSKGYFLQDLLSYVDESSGEYWVESGEVVKIPYRRYTLNDYRFLPAGFKSNLKLEIHGDSASIIVNEAGFVELYYDVEVKVNILVSYSKIEKIWREEWIPIGSQYKIQLSSLLSPRTIGERIELRSLKSDLDYEFVKDGEAIILEVDSPGNVEINIDRYFLVRVYSIPSLDKMYPSCIGPPDLTEWNLREGFTEIWVLEKTPLTCYFPEKIDNQMMSVLFLKGHAGDTEYTTPGLKSFYVKEPLTIYMEYKVVRYFQLRGRTDRGVFIGGGVYPEGAQVAWRVEPQEYPADGLLGLLGFRWRALNSIGVEDLHGDRVVEIIWVLTPSIDSPILQFLQLTSIITVSYIAYVYHKMWRIRVKGAMQGDEYIED
jgi:hypothetical protein